MNVIIVGAGTVGFHIASQLIEENEDVVIIERDPEAARYVSNNLDCIVINDEATRIEVLKNAGIQKADYFISVTDSDEVNMISCGLVSSEFNVPFKIARVRNLEYTHTKILKKSFLNIDLIVNPEVEAARVICQTVSQGVASDMIFFEKTDVQMRNLYVDTASIFIDKSLMEIKQSLNENFLIAGIKRRNTVFIPSGNTRVKKNDTLYLISSQKILEKIFSISGKKNIDIKKIIIVGGSKIGILVASELLKNGYSLKIIDKDHEKCKFLSLLFPEPLIINADISDEDIYEEEQLFDNDLIISTTNFQELNILSAIYAKSLGVKRSLAVVGKSSYLTIASELGIDSTVNAKTSAADTILKFIRGSHIESVHSILDGKAEVMELSVGASTEIVGTPLMDMQMPNNSLIITVTRNGENFIPSGDFIINEGDNVLIITKKKSIPKIVKMFT